MKNPSFPNMRAEASSRAPATPLTLLVAAAALTAAFGCGDETGTQPGAQVPSFQSALPGDESPEATEPPSDGNDDVEAPGDDSTPSGDVDRAQEGGQNGGLDLVDGESEPSGGGSEAPDSTMEGADPDVPLEGDEAADPIVVPEVGGYPEHTGADCDVSPGAQQPNPNFPDPFSMHDGTRITTMAEWACRRAEIKRDVEQFEIGPKPEPPTVQASLNGGSLNVTVTTGAGSLTLTSNVSSPGGAGPHCVAIGMNGNSSLINGCVQVPFIHNQVVAYAQNSNQSQNDPFYQAYPELFGQIGNYAAWSWGISRLIDGLSQVQDELNIDMSKIGVHGCSYAGKMALFGGALDERVALTVAQESGGGGINSWRTSQDFTNRTGTQIEKIDNTNYGWFKGSMRGLNEHNLPHDHHELIAMIAPRAVVALGNPPFEWLGDESGYKSMMAAREVWVAMGIEDRIGFDFASGHNHCAATQGQSNTVNAFVNKFLKDQDANTNINLAPDQASGFDLNYRSVIDWQTPTLE